ncbi:MAG: nuclear pore complex subunit [Salinivirgaceae bacterium]|nr:MAG: nuclear pore complex subunit [Salinivirgaceae bacterium]
MMIPVLYIEATKDTPKILFDAENNQFEISEKSLPEDAIGFFQPVFDWLNQYIDNPKEESTFVFYLDYYSTSTAKQLTKIFYLIEKLSEKSKVKVVWKYQDADIDMYHAGLRYQKMLKIDFDIQKV